MTSSDFVLTKSLLITWEKSSSEYHLHLTGSTCGCHKKEYERVNVPLHNQRETSTLSMKEDTKSWLETGICHLWDSHEVNDLQAIADHCVLLTKSQKNMRHQLGNLDTTDLCIPSWASPPSEDSTSPRLAVLQSKSLGDQSALNAVFYKPQMLRVLWLLLLSHNSHRDEREAYVKCWESLRRHDTQDIHHLHQQCCCFMLSAGHRTPTRLTSN